MAIIAKSINLYMNIYNLSILQGKFSLKLVLFL